MDFTINKSTTVKLSSEQAMRSMEDLLYGDGLVTGDQPAHGNVFQKDHLERDQERVDVGHWRVGGGVD